MSKICSYCEKPVKIGYDYCIHCGRKIIHEPLYSETAKSYEAEETNKKQSNYILNSDQRYLFLHKILPTLLIGSIIWLTSEIIFSYIFSETQFIGPFFIFYIVMVVVDSILFIILYFIAKANLIRLALLIFFLFSAIAGILSIPIVIFTQFLPQVHMFVSLSLGANLIVGLLGITLRSKYFAKGYIWAHVIVFGIGCFIFEVIFILIFEIQNFLLTIPITLAYICVTSLTVMFYGAKTMKKTGIIPWMVIVFKILGILLLAIVLAAVVVVIVVIIIVIAIACGDSNIDFGSFSGGGSGGWRKKKKQKSNINLN